MKKEPLIVTKKGDLVQELYVPESGFPEIHIDGIQGLYASGHIIKFNCFSREFSDSENVEVRNLACRLTMGIDTFFSIASFFQSQAEVIKKDLGITVETVNTSSESDG